VSGSLRAGVTFPSSSPLEGNPSTHWAFRPVCVHPKRESSATQHTDRTRAGHRRRAFPVLRVGSRIHAMRAHSSARRQVDRQQDRLVAKTRGASPREATSCRDLESEPQGTLARVKNGCRARNARPLQGSRVSRAKVSSAEETRTFHEVRCANRSWSAANEPSELREGRSKSTTGTRGGGCDAPPGKKRPASHRSAITEARTAT